MTYRPQPKYASRDAKRGAWTTCDDCGFIWNQSDMAFQYDYVGGPIPEDMGWLRCPRCITPLTYQRKLLVIPPDPPPLMNTRPEPYAVEETSWLTTMDGEVYGTSGGDPYVTSNPNPADNANTSVLVLMAELSFAGTLFMAYLDLFIGNPAAGGTSILDTITGSSIRTNVLSQLTANSDNVLQNSAVITVVPEAAPLPNVAYALSNVTHIGIYSAETGGTLLTSGPIGATFPTIVQTAVVQFNQLGLQIAQV